MILGTTQTIMSVTAIPTANPDSKDCAILLPGASSPTSGVTTVESNLLLSTVVTPQVGGVWQFTFSAEYASGISFENVRLVPATRLDIRTLTFEKIGIDPTELAQSTFDLVACAAITFWLDQISSVYANYDALSVGNQIHFDMAMVEACCGLLRGYKDFAAQAPVGELDTVKTGNDSISFHPTQKLISATDAMVSMSGNVWRALSLIPGIQTLLATVTYPVFVAAGKRNALRRTLGRTDTYNPRYSFDFDELMDYMYNGGYLNGLAE